MEEINCPNCNHSKYKKILTSKDYINNLDGKFDIVQCKKCDFMYTNPRPNNTEIAKYYPGTYTPYIANVDQVKKLVNLKTKHPTLFNIINPMATTDLYPNKKHQKILEIGCGAGNFLYQTKLLHPNWDISGTDFNKESVNSIKKMGINAFTSDLTKLPQKTNSLDTVYGWMVLEHVHNINKVLGEINRVLKPQGTFCFSVPNAGSWELSFFEKYWHGLHLPNHLYHFTPSSLTQILNSNDFVVSKIIHQKTFSNVASSSSNYLKDSKLPGIIKNSMLKILKWKSIHFLLTLPIATLLAFFKQSGRITVITNKK